MRWLKVCGLAVIIWGMNLLWPDVYKVLNLPAAVWMTLALASLALVYGLGRLR